MNPQYRLLNSIFRIISFGSKTYEIEVISDHASNILIINFPRYIYNLIPFRQKKRINFILNNINLGLLILQFISKQTQIIHKQLDLYYEYY